MKYRDELILEALLRIKNRDESMRSHDEMVVESLKGRRVRLVFTDDEYKTLQPGDEGTVWMVDAVGSVQVDWDRLEDLPDANPALLPGIDRWEWL
jgi:Domain of unknown function (DUF4314)